MTVGRTEETRKEGREKRLPSVTALSTIAVQSGQTQVVVSVLKSGSSVHLQLVQVEPGLCEIGADQEENQTLIREQKQLLEKLKKHEAEVLSSVDKKRRQRGGDWLSDQRGPPEEQEGVYGAMKSSLKEGWTLLLRLLNRRLHTLSLTADFYHTVKEFAVGIEKLEDLEIQPGSLSDAQHSYISIRRDLLGKSLQLLGISSDLMRKLRDLQKTEALQRQGEVLQEEEEEDDQESAVCPLTCVLKLQEVVEALQDRRRTVDQEVKRQIQLAQNNSQIHPGEQGPVERQEWSLEEILAQNLSFTPDAESDLLLGSSPEQSEVSPIQTGANELKYQSNSSLMSTSSNENLGTAFELEEEQQLRVESRTENKKPTPAYGFEERQETVDDDPTSIKSLESLAEKNEGSLQELELEECMNFDAEPKIELLELKSESVEPCVKSSLHMENLSAMNLDEEIEEHIEKDWEKSSKFRSSSNVARIQQSDTKWESRPRSLPIFNVPSLQVHSEMRETNSLKLNTDELKQNLEDKRSNQDCSNDSAFQDHNNFHTPSGLPNSEELLIESSLKIDNLDSDINSYIPNEAVPEMERFSNENLMAISASKQEPLAKLEHRSRSLPIFNLVSTKLQPKLQESKDLLNIATNEMSTSFEEKPFENSNLQFEINSQCDAALMEEVEVSENIETENGTDLNNEPQMDEIRALYIDSSLKDIADLTIIPDQKTRDESQGISTSTSVEPTSMSVDQSEQEHDTPEKKLESFSERFKKLQSKWQEKEDVTMESKSTSYKVQNLNAVASNKPKEHSNKVSEEMNQWETEAQSSVVDNVMPLCFEEHSEEQLVHQTEVKTSVETVVKIETSTVEKYELAFDNSTSELKKEEPTCVHLEEIEKLCASCDQLTDKVCVWMEQCSCELSRSDPGQCLSEAQHTLNLNIQLQSEAQALEEEVQSMEQSLDQLRVQYPEVPARVESVVKHLNTVSSTIQSNLHLLGPYVSFLQAGEEVKAHFELLKQTYSQKPEMEETVEETKWLTAQDKFLITQELGNHFNTNLYKVEGAGLQQESMAHVVMETLVHLSEAKEEVEELQRHYQRQIQQLRDDRDYCLKYRDRLDKTVKDLQCVSELLDSCTVIDVGSEPHSSRLLQQFNQARPHFTQLDSEANFITCNFETLSRLQKRWGPLVTHTVTETDVSALLDLHLRLKQKIEESQSILELSSSFHLIIKQLEDLLQSKPITCGQGRSAEEKLNLLKVKKEQIHNVFNRAFNLKMDLCDGVTNSSVCGLRVQQLEACLHTVDSHRLAWLSEAARCEEKVLREMKTEALLHDIQLLRDSFKELKKRFSNLKINYVKRNDRSRNIKAVRNQLQQVDSFEDKLQSLKSRLQGLSARLQSEVKDGGSVRELEDLLNDLQRQMGESERNIKEHRKTLDMTCSLQEAMDEYQLWCEEASGTIARVGKFSTECRSTEAVAVLYRQFEKFVWPTVPQQEERISQITELAVRLHGADEGQRFIEKTVSKHSEMVAAIRALSDGLLELEEKLKVQSLKPQQKDEQQVEIKDSQMDESVKEKDTGKDMKVEEKSEQKEQMDNRTTQEAAEMYELKETGHTPELTNKHDGKETPARRHSFNKKPPLQKQRMHQDTDRLVSSSFCSTHTFSLSCSPLETNRQVFAISQGLPPPSSREALKVKREEPLNTTLDTGAGSLYETELHHHHEVLSEDSLSTDEYDCPSPDDISLPPLAETPESFLVQSDLEEGGYFGSQHSYRSHRESAENQHSVSRYRTDSGSFVPSPLTVPIPTQVLADFTTTMYVIATEATTGPLQQSIYDNIPNQPSRNTEPIPQVHNPSLNLNFPTISMNISEEIPCLLPDKSLSNSLPVSKSSLHQEITSFEITKKSDQVLKDISADIELTKSKVSNVTSQNNPTTMFHKTQHRKDFTNALEHNPTSTALLAKKVGNESLKLSMIYPQKETVLCQESSKCGQQEKEAATLIKLAACNSLTTAVIKETVYTQSSMSSRSLVQTVSDAAGHNEKVIEDIKLVAMNENDFPKPSKYCNDQMPRESKDIKERSSWVTFDDSLANPSQELRGASSKESACIDYFSSPHNATSSANNTVDIQQNHQTAYHETPTEQCVHDPSSNAPPEAQTQALTWRANTHATPSRTSSPHLLTPDQDPDVCQPCTIREEIRLTRQIKGPSLRPQGPEECSCFMRPVSQAAVMGGSPVTLEVEVAGQPEPKLTWCKDGTEEEERIRAANRTHEDGKATDGAVCEAWLAATGGKDRKNYSDDDDDEGGREEERGVMAEIYNIMTADWQTWFGTLCFLLWLLFLIII